MTLATAALQHGAALPCAVESVDTFLSTPTDGVLECLQRTQGPFLVLGAGGKMGLHLCLMLKKGLGLLQRADRVIAVSRFSSLRDAAEFTAHGIEVIAGDLTEASFLAGLPEAPVVFFLAGVKFGTSSAPDLLRRMNVEMPRLVARRFSRARIVAFSSGCVYPFVPPASGGAIEDTPVSPQGEYAQSCLARESAFADISRECGTRVLLLRLNYSVEFRYGLLLDIATKVAAGRPVDVTMGHCNVIWQGDAIAHTIQSLELAAQPARPLNITGPDLLSVRELAEAFGSLLSVPVTIEGTEAPTAWLNNAGESHRLLGRPSVAIETMLGWVAAWVKSGGESWGKPTGFERRDGKF